MNIVQENIDGLNALVRIQVSSEDYSANYKKALREYKKQVSIPGFRPGKIPNSVVEKKYGRTLLTEELNKLVSNSLQQHIIENKLDVLGNPLPKTDNGIIGDWENPADFEFIYELGLSPVFDIKLDKRKKFTYNKVKIDDSLIDKQEEDLRRRYGKLSNVEVAAEKDMIVGEFAELDGEGNVVESELAKSSTVSLEFLENEAAKAQFIGKKVEDVLAVNPKDLARDEKDLASMLGVDASQTAELVDTFQFTIKEIKRLDVSELTEEFFNKVFGEGEVKTQEEMRAKIAEDLVKMFEADSDRIFKRDLSQELMKKLQLELPDTFLKKWIMSSNEKPVTLEQVETEYVQYADGLRLQLIENKIVKDNGIKVEQTEALEYTKELIGQQYAQYGMPIPEDEEFTKVAQGVLQNQDEAKRVYEMLYDRKILSFLKEAVKINEVEVSYDEFAKIASQQA